MQLVAYGAQDIYLTGNPQITFFKVVYRRHTNFSMESIKQTFSGTADFGKDVTATISRNGDLVYRMYLEHNALFTQSNPTGHDNRQIGLVERYGDSLIKECEIEIGGQKIDKHYAMWNRVWSDLTEYNPSGHFGEGGALANGAGTLPVGGGTLYQRMTGNGLGLNTSIQASACELGAETGDNFLQGNIVNGFKYTRGDGNSNGTSLILPAAVDVNKIFLPLNFWFNRNPGLALPLIALQYHEVKVKMTFETLANLTRCVTGNTTFVDAIPGVSGSTVTASLQKFDLWTDYIYLDTDERRRFAQVSHEYLIEQLQRSEDDINTATPSINLNFNHPVKELVWCMRNESEGTGQGGRHATPATNIGDSSSGPVSLDEMGGNWKLVLNGHDRFKERDSKYFTRTQVWEHHTGYGGVPTFGASVHAGMNDPQILTNVGHDSIAVYSFALKPEEHQPSGTCNFSRIDNAQLTGSALTSPAGVTDVDKIMPLVTINGTTTTDSVKMTIFAVNYNVLRIMSGMGGLAYSN